MTDGRSDDAGRLDPDQPSGVSDGRGALIRRSFLLQLKLIVDGIRDFLLVPIAMVATLLGLLRGGDEPAREFNRVIELGRQSDEWIDLFGIHQDSAVPNPEVQSSEDVAAGVRSPGPGGNHPRNLEAWANRAEAAIQNEIKSGQLSEQAARALRRALGRTEEDGAPPEKNSEPPGQ